MIRRRHLLIGAAGAALLAGRVPERLARLRLPLTVYRPGMAAGHWLRDHPALPYVAGERQIDTLIVGSGIGGLTTAWRLKREGYDRFLLLRGPETFGNAACGHAGSLEFPLGAHYLPIPTSESQHVREMLSAFGLLEGPASASQPRYDERVLIHAPQERLWIDGHWQEGLIPTRGVSPEDKAQQACFFAFITSLKRRRGSDGRVLFAIPTALSSQDPEWRALDRLNFADWQTQNGYTAPGLRWYLNYCCRDDYGAGAAQTSAWAGLHYFASRTGEAANADEDALLTWPGGLHPLAERISQASQAQQVEGFAVRADPVGKEWQVLAAASPGAPLIRYRCRNLVMAMPLHVAARLLPTLPQRGFDASQHMPAHAPWMVSNFALNGFPAEPRADEYPLAWDNAVYGSPSMGYVVASHQLIQVARPELTVFTAYQALSHDTPEKMRHWLAGASDAALLQEAATDLQTIYGGELWQHAQSIHITLRGHAMAVPAPGFLHNPGLQALRETGDGLYFAHADLSSLSIFEEASWWGWQAAEHILAR